MGCMFLHASDILCSPLLAVSSSSSTCLLAVAYRIIYVQFRNSAGNQVSHAMVAGVDDINDDAEGTVAGLVFAVLGAVALILSLLMCMLKIPAATRDLLRIPATKHCS